MTGDYVEQRNGGYYVAGTRVTLDSVVYSFRRGNSPETIQAEFPLLKLSLIYGAIAFYLDHQSEVDQSVEEKRRELESLGIPLSESNPELWAKLNRARQTMDDKKS
ncbi:MAG: DUF433 domain-containing protein [Gammaproteobacteria bacterium]